MRECAGYETQFDTVQSTSIGCNMRECAGYEDNKGILGTQTGVAICESVPGTRPLLLTFDVSISSCNMRECAGYEL